MKHIKKKFLIDGDINEGNLLEKNGKVIELNDKEIHSRSKKGELYLQTTNDQLLKVFSYKKTAIIPIPDLTLAYFDMAYYLNKTLRDKFQTDLFRKTNLEINSGRIDEIAINEIYHFYGSASGCVIMLHTALESFINFILPDDKEYKKVLSNKTECYSKEQIQKSINFDEKLKTVLPYFHHNKNYFLKETPNTQHIRNLKELRDDIVHTKSEREFKTQEKLIKKLLDFKYEETFNAVKSFMNFYKKDYVEECQCGLDF